MKDGILLAEASRRGLLRRGSFGRAAGGSGRMALEDLAALPTAMQAVNRALPAPGVALARAAGPRVTALQTALTVLLAPQSLPGEAVRAAALATRPQLARRVIAAASRPDNATLLGQLRMAGPRPQQALPILAQLFERAGMLAPA